MYSWVGLACTNPIQALLYRLAMYTIQNPSVQLYNNPYTVIKPTDECTSILTILPERHLLSASNLSPIPSRGKLMIVMSSFSSDPLPASASLVPFAHQAASQLQ